jgi:flagellar biosynthetic protein FliR
MDLFIEKLLGFAIVLTRLSAFFLVVPVFGSLSIPVRIRVALTVLLAIFFSIISPLPFNTSDISPLKAVLLLSNEAIYGFCLGLIVAVLFGAVKFAGHIIEREMGLNMAEILDPLTGEQGQPLGTLLEMIFIFLFLSANGHHLFLLTISRSYDAFPAGSCPTAGVMLNGVIDAGSAMLTAGLRMAAPILAVSIILMVVLAVLARVVPEMDILFTSFPLRIGICLFMTVIFVPFIGGFISEFADWMAKLLPLQ